MLISYDIYQTYYKMGLFTKENLDMFEQVGWLTADQVKQIEG